MMPLLYMMNEWKNSSLLPAYLFMENAKSTISPITGSSPFIDWLHAASALISRTAMTFEKPDFGIESVDINGESVVIKQETLLRKSFCDLVLFKRTLIQSSQMPVVLIVAPMSGHFATLLRDTVKTVLQDFDVYITDWKDAKHIPLEEGDFSLDTYTAYLIDFINFIQKKGHPLFILGVCQPAVPVMAAISLLAGNTHLSQPQGMILMGGPVDTRINPGKVNAFAKRHDTNWVEEFMITQVTSQYEGSGRHVLPGFLLLGSFMALNPTRHQESLLKFYQHLVQGDDDKSVEKHEAFYNEYRAVMDLSATYFLDSYRHVFCDFSLPKGQLTWDGLKVDPSLIKKTALLTIEGELDDISPVGQTYAAHALCSNIPAYKKVHYLQEGAGHYGIFNGTKWRTEIYPIIKNFIIRHKD